MDILDRIRLDTETNCRLKKDSLVVVGVSGGADSLCLMDALLQLGYPLLVAHFDHELRAASGADADKVAGIARAKGVAFMGGKGDVKAYARQYKCSLEEAARKMRYTFLFEAARKHSAQAVAVGHTADDQVETVLMHLLRGSGLSGLKGMTYRSTLNEWDADIPVARPLLGVWREETHAYCAEHHLDVVEDLSNQETTYFRNRLRLALIPELERYNPQVRQALLRMSRTLSSDWDVLESTVDSAWAECLIQEGEGFVRLRLADLLDKQPGLQANIIRRGVSRILPGLRDFDQAAVERALAFMQSPSSRRGIELPGKLQVRLEGESLVIIALGVQLPGENWPQVPEGFIAQLEFPGEVILPGGWRLASSAGKGDIVSPEDFTANTRPINQPALPVGDCFEAWLDADRLVWPLELRRHRAGERWQPLGMLQGTIKLSDFFTNVKLPKAARAGWPVLFSGENVAWLPGFRPAQTCRVDTGTTRFAHITLSSKVRL